jgi:hypothetical protein
MNLNLQIIIYNILENLSDASAHYVIFSRYFFFGQQMHSTEPVHLNKDTVREVSLQEDGIECRMMLDANDAVFSIVIPFESIDKIVKVYQSKQNVHTLFWRQNKKEVLLVDPRDNFIPTLSNDNGSI